MSLAAAMEIGKQGMQVYQVATEVVSENIANVNTPGYSQQRVLLESAPPTTANGFPLGTGVKIASVERVYDSLLQQQLVNAGTTSSYDSTRSQVLQQVEPVFNEIAQSGLGAAIDGFFGAWQDLSVNPTGAAEQQGVISKAKIMTDQFNYAANTLTNTQTMQDQGVAPLTSQINQQLQNIASLNSQIKTTQQVSGNANEMKDQRDYLISQLAQNMGVKYTENSDGTTDVYVTDNSASPSKDYYLVKGGQSGTVNSSGTPAVVTVTDYLGATSNALDPTKATPFYSTSTSGGKLWSILTMRDVTIPGYLNQVNSLANTMVSAVNNLHSNPPNSNAYTTAGVPGGNFFDPTKTTAATISVALTSASQIASSGSATTPGDNTNALALADLQNANTMSGNTTTFSLYYSSLVSQVGLDVQTAKSVVSQDGAFTKQLQTLRDSTSGVSLDQELTNLMQYQRSYQASAKLITTTTDMMDTAINMIK